jgi:hypothetical protein
MDDHSSQTILKGLGYGVTHLIDTKPVVVGQPGQKCQIIYLYEAMGDEGLSIFGLDYEPGSEEFGDEDWCNAAYDAMEELAAVRPAGVPLGFMICTPMQRPDPSDPQTVHAFWYGIGMDLPQGQKVTIKQEPIGPFVVKPVQQEEMAGMLDQLGEVFG